MIRTVTVIQGPGVALDRVFGGGVDRYHYREPRLNFQSSQQQSVVSLIKVVITVGVM
jgi:hypothetical protein